MAKKAYFGISLVIAIGLCLALLVFPVLKYDEKSVVKYSQTLVNSYMQEGYSEEDAIQLVIDEISMALQIYGDADSINSEDGFDKELLNMSLERIRKKGIKYIDLASGIKNQVEYNSKLRKALKADTTLTNKDKKAILKAEKIDVFPFIGLVIFIALEFAAAFLIIIRSIKGILERRKTKLIRISIFGTVFSFCLIILPALFRKEITEIKVPSDYIDLFISSVHGASLCYYCFFGFLTCLVLSIFAKFTKNEHKF